MYNVDIHGDVFSLAARGNGKKRSITERYTNHDESTRIPNPFGHCRIADHTLYDLIQ